MGRVVGLPRVPDGRAGHAGVILLGQGYVNRHLCSLLGTLGRIGCDFRWEILYFGGSRVGYTHLGCFGAPGRAGGGWRAFMG